MHPRTVYIFLLHFSTWPLSGLVGESASPPIRLHPPSGAAGICPLIFLSFTRCITKPWIFAWYGLSDVSDLDIILMDPLRSWGSFAFSMSPTFSEGVLKFFGEFSNRSRAIWLVCAVRSPHGSLLLLSGIQPSYRLSDGASVGSCLSLSSLWWYGLQKFGGTASLRPGKSAPCLIFLSSRDGEGFGGLLPFSPAVFFG